MRMTRTDIKALNKEQAQQLCKKLTRERIETDGLLRDLRQYIRGLGAIEEAERKLAEARAAVSTNATGSVF